MEKEKFQKILNCRGCSTSSDFTAKEKERLFVFFEKHGMTRGTAYNRFFRDGFKLWEIQGINGCVNDFSERNGLQAIDDLDKFYRNLKTKTQFKEYMKLRGMSKGTVIKYFSPHNTFAEWEKAGVKNLIDLLMEEDKNAEEI